MKRLILIRHGETDYTLKKRFCGQENIPLNISGKAEVRRLRQRLARFKIDRIYSSDLKRALETAKILFKERVIFKRKCLREIDFGCISGMTYDEVNTLYPAVLRSMEVEPLSMKIPQGEGLVDFSRRVTKCYWDIALENRNKTVAIVSHGGPIRIILLNLAGLTLDSFWKIEVDTAAFDMIEF